MKKILSILMCSALLFSTAACSGDTSGGESASLPTNILDTESQKPVAGSSAISSNVVLNENAFEFVTFSNPNQPFVLSLGETLNGLTFSSLDFVLGTDAFPDAQEDSIAKSAEFTGELTLTGTLRFDSYVICEFYPDEASQNKILLFPEQTSTTPLYFGKEIEDLLEIITSEEILEAGKNIEYTNDEDLFPCTVTINSLTVYYGHGSYVAVNPTVISD